MLEHLRRKQVPRSGELSDSPTTSSIEASKDKILTDTSAVTLQPDSPSIEKGPIDELTNDPSTAIPDPDYPHGLKLIGILFGLCCSIFLVALDQTIIAIAIPEITNHFKRIDDIGWYASAYFLTSCALQPTWGKIYQSFSIKWFFIGAVSVFEFGSLICGIAPTSTTLIFGRAIAGLGVAGIFSGGLTIIAYSVPLAKRPQLMGAFGAMFGIASVAGPLLGGIFTVKLSWRWCFYLNLPIGAITLVTVVFLVKVNQVKQTRSVKERLREIDFLGAACLLPSVICLLLALQWGGNTYPWKSSKISGLFVGFVLLGLIFVGIQLKQQDQGTIPPRIIRKRSVSASCCFGAFFGGSFFVMAYYIPIYFQSIKGSSAVHSGIQLLPLMISVVISSIFWGIVIGKIGYYTPILIGGAMFLTVGAGLITTWKVDSKTGIWFGYQVIMGLGAGSSFQIPLIAVQCVLDLKDIPSGAALVSFSQSIGGAILIAVAQSLFSNNLLKGLDSRIADKATIQQIIAAGATGFRHTIDPSYLPAVYASYQSGLVAAYKVSLTSAALALLASFFVEFRSLKNNPNSGMAVAV